MYNSPIVHELYIQTKPIVKYFKKKLVSMLFKLFAVSTNNVLLNKGQFTTMTILLYFHKNKKIKINNVRVPS